MGVDTATASVFSTLVLQSAIGIVVYVLFELFRSQKEIYTPKLRSKSGRCPPPPPSGLFGWIKNLLTLSDEDTLKMTGLDGFIFLRYLKLVSRVGFGCGIFGLITLVPIYGTAKSQPGVVGIAMYTMAKISPGGGRLWASLICYWVYTLLLLYLLYKEYEYFTQLRQDFLKSGDPDLEPQQLLSVVVENIPLTYRSSTKLKQLFEELYPGDIFSAKIGLRYDSLLAIAEQRKQVITALENAVALDESTQHTKPPMIKIKSDGKPAFIFGGEPVEAIPYWEKELLRLNQEIDEIRKEAYALDNFDTSLLLQKPIKEAENDSNNVIKVTIDSITGTGFVTFQSTRSHASSYQLTALHDQFPEMKITPTDGPHNILWRNIHVTLDYIRVASGITKCFYLLGLIFWSLIIAFIASVSQISTLEKFLPFLKQLDPVSYSLLQGQLPVIILIIFISLLPLIFQSVSIYIERRKTQTDVQTEVFTWFFLYQLVNVYLMVLAGSVFGALKDILANPLSIVNLLAESLPTVATFFLNYFLTLLLSGVPLLLLQIAPYAIFKLYRLCFNQKKLTLRTLLEGPLGPCSIDYSLLIPTILYPVCIALTYMVIAPILFAVAGLYFVCCYVVWKYQLCYVVVQPNETGGKFWYQMFQYTYTGLMASNITMIGYMAIKQAIAPTILLIPLPILVYLTWNYTHEKFYQFSCNLSHRQAILKDKQLEKENISSLFNSNFYLPLILQPKKSNESPQPYRLDEIDLLDSNGYLNLIYYPVSSSSQTDTESGQQIGQDDGKGYGLIQSKASEVELKQVSVKSKSNSKEEYF